MVNPVAEWGKIGTQTYLTIKIPMYQVVNPVAEWEKRETSPCQGA